MGLLALLEISCPAMRSGLGPHYSRKPREAALRIHHPSGVSFLVPSLAQRRGAFAFQPVQVSSAICNWEATGETSEGKLGFRDSPHVDGVERKHARR